jgi:large subunit ribosomal protein L4
MATTKKEIKAKTTKATQISNTEEKKVASKTAEKKVTKTPVKAEASVVAEPKKASSKEATIKIDVYDIKGKVVEQIQVPAHMFGAKANPTLIAQAVRVYLANQRAGSAHTKTRGEVAGSTRKIYKQKGTGRARHGAIRAPIFVKGGIALGPRTHDFSLKLSQNMKKAALASALSTKVSDGGVKIVSGMGKIAPKTKEMVAVLNNLQLNGKVKKILFVLPSSAKASPSAKASGDKSEGKPSDKEFNLDHIIRSSRNIEGVTLTRAHQLTTYDVLHSNAVLFVKEAIEGLTK